MRSPGLAIAWSVWSRHRLGLSISAAILLLLAIALPPILLRYDNPTLFVITAIPAAMVAAFVANALLFTDEVGNLTSGYPRRMFGLPLATRSLAFWPMLISVGGMVVLWLAIAVLIYQRGGYQPPLLLSALALAVTMAWLQTVCWLPIASPTLRTYATLLGLWLLVATPAWMFLREEVSATTLCVLGLVELVGLCALANLGLRHSRRGDDWSLGIDRAAAWLLRRLDGFSAHPEQFQSAAAAQLWYECRCHELMIQVGVVLVLAWIGLIYLWIPQGKMLAFHIGLGCMLGTPIIMAGSAGASIGRLRPVWSRQRGFNSFLATRPIRNEDILQAKYRLIARSVGRFWLMTLAMAATVVLARGQGGDVADQLRAFLQLVPGWRGWAALGLAVVLAPAFTWKLLTDSLAPALTGRRWFGDAAVMLSAVFLIAVVGVAVWYAQRPALLARHLPSLCWLMAASVLVRCIVAAVGFRAALARGLIQPRYMRTVLIIVALSALATLAFFAILIPPGSIAAPRLVVLLGTLSFVPLARFALAPLALEWNLHR